MDHLNATKSSAIQLDKVQPGSDKKSHLKKEPMVQKIGKFLT
jgi:hypothetical protein